MEQCVTGDRRYCLLKVNILHLLMAILQNITEALSSGSVAYIGGQRRLSLYSGGAGAPQQKLGEGFLGPWVGKLIILT